jgi:hypothetical protein
MQTTHSIKWQTNNTRHELTRSDEQPQTFRYQRGDEVPITFSGIELKSLQLQIGRIVNHRDYTFADFSKKWDKASKTS